MRMRFLFSSNINLVKDGSVIQISCGLHHTTALTANGKVYAWGDNSHCQTVGNVEIVYTPTLVSVCNCTFMVAHRQSKFRVYYMLLM